MFIALGRPRGGGVKPGTGTSLLKGRSTRQRVCQERRGKESAIPGTRPP